MFGSIVKTYRNWIIIVTKFLTTYSVWNVFNDYRKLTPYLDKDNHNHSVVIGWYSNILKLVEYGSSE